MLFAEAEHEQADFVFSTCSDTMKPNINYYYSKLTLYRCTITVKYCQQKPITGLIEVYALAKSFKQVVLQVLSMVSSFLLQIYFHLHFGLHPPRELFIFHFECT